VILQTVCFG